MFALSPRARRAAMFALALALLPTVGRAADAPGVTVTVLPAPPDGWKPVTAFATADAHFARAALVAEKGSMRRAVIDGVPGPEFLIVNDVRFAPDGSNFWYVGSERGGKQWVVTSGARAAAPGMVKSGAILFSPDSKRLLYVTTDGEGGRRYDPATNSTWFEFPARVVLDGAKEKKFGLVGTPAFSPDSKRYAHIAMLDGRPVVVIDGKVARTAELLPDLLLAPAPRFSPDSKRVAYLIESRLGKQCLVVDEDAGRWHSKVTQFKFSPDSKRVAHTASDRGEYTVYVDGAPVPGTFTRVMKSLAFSPDSKRLAFAAFDGRRGVVIVDGKAVASGDGTAAGPVFSPDSKRVAFVSISGKECALVVDGKELAGGFESALCEPVFSPDSKRVAVALRRGKSAVMLVDGREVGTHDEIDLSAPAFSADSKHFAYWARTGTEWYLMLDGEKVPVAVHKPLRAEPQRLDFEDFVAPAGLAFAADGTLRAAALLDSAGRVALLAVRPGDKWADSVKRADAAPAADAARKAIAEPTAAAHKAPADSLAVGTVWKGTCWQTGVAPFAMEMRIDKRDGDTFEGTTTYPSLKGEAKFKGKIDGDTVTFREYERVRGPIHVPTSYEAELSGTTIKGLWRARIKFTSYEDPFEVKLSKP